MYSVKKFTLKAAQSQTYKVNGITYHAPPCWGVVDECGQIVIRETAIGPRFEAYESKTIAQYQADWHNRQEQLTIAENLTWVTVEKMLALVDANLYYVTPDGDQAKPNLQYCRADAPNYRRVYGAGWERV